MSEEEIMEGNKLIAEFMDLKNFHTTNWYTDNDKIGFYIDDKICYHSSYDWLMPVVEKMEKMGYGMDITPHDVTVIDYVTGNEEERVRIENDDNYPKIDLIYWAVIGFIGWFSKNYLAGRHI